MQRILPVMDWMNLWPQPLHKNTKKKYIYYYDYDYHHHYYYYYTLKTILFLRNDGDNTQNTNKWEQNTEMLKQLKQKTMIDDHYWLEYVNMKRKWMEMDCNEKSD